MRIARRMWLSRSSAKAVVLLTTLGLCFYPIQLACADLLGPCTQDSKPKSSNNVKCQNGACTGQSTIVYATSSCKNHPENPSCTNNANQPQQTTTPPTPVYAGTSTWLGCLASNGWNYLCVACIAGAGAVCVGTAALGCAAASGVCGVVCTGTNTTIDPCCWTYCTFNAADSVTVNGATTCN